MPDLGQPPSRERARIRRCRGPRAAERALFAEVDRLLEQRPQPLTGSILIVVPSLSLRSHLTCRLAERLDRAVLGLAVRTHHHVAADLVERADGPPPLADGLLALLARRHGRREPALSRALAHLDQGFDSVAVSVRDLIEAGLRPEHADPVREALAEEEREHGASPERDRAAAVVAVAARVGAEMEARGLLSTPDLLTRAAEIASGGAAALADTEVLIHGFGDATGVATDFLEALLATTHGTLILDQPADPVERTAVDAGVHFTRRFAERLELAADGQEDAGELPTPPVVEMLRAAGGEAEVREVAYRARALLDRGETAERIAIVARRLEPYRAPLRRWLEHLAVPYSAVGFDGPLLPAGRRLRVLWELLVRGERLSTERWLEIQAGVAPGAEAHLLPSALLSLGAGRLAEVAELEFEPLLRDGSYRLELTRGFASVDDGGEPGRLHRFQVPARRLVLARAAARRLLARLAELGEASSLGEHAWLLGELLRSDLSWADDDTATTRFESAWTLVAGSLPDAFELDFDELRELLYPALNRAGRDAFGGHGGGVQILDVTEARGRTFDHLLVLGLNRGVFPRAVREDPLLPDAVRHVLARTGHGVLPDLSPKLAGFDEERYLFAQLLDAAPAITLSWQEVDEDGGRRIPSPLVERLRWAAPGAVPASWSEPPLAPNVHAHRDTGRERSAAEAAIAAGMRSPRTSFADLLPVVLRESGRKAPLAARLAGARMAVLDEIDPVRGSDRGQRTRARLGPYFGLVGSAVHAADPRAAAALAVTRLEALARCPWKHFVGRVLGVAAAPDPLEVLPGIEGSLVGSLVHDVLELLVEEQIGRSPRRLEEIGDRLPLGIRWPDPAVLDRLVERRARRLVRRKGIALPGFARALGEVIRPHLEMARRLDWSDADGGPTSVAVEVTGELEIPGTEGPEGGGRRLRFRADRADLRDGRLVLTDYKTGRRVIVAKGAAATLERRLRAAVASGEWLQAAAYALARNPTESGADAGRYLFLNPTIEVTDEARGMEASGDDEELAAAFFATAGKTLALWDRGLLFPRLVEPESDKEPRLCTVCEVAEACLRGDSSARTRLRDWAAADAGREDDPLMAVWRLPGKPEWEKRR